MAIIWEDRFATGVHEVDEAHKKLFGWVNQLSDAMKQGKGAPEVLRILNLLGAYAATHFAHEEGCMHAMRCPSALANKKAHAEFIAYFTRLKQECERNGVTTAKVLELQSALGGWLRSHIMKVDVSLRDCLQHADA
jgi:hemerythrin-like metal-binding protein